MTVANIEENLFCFDNVPAGTCTTLGSFDSSTSNNANLCCDGEFDMINYRRASARIVYPCFPCKSCTSIKRTLVIGYNIGPGFPTLGNDPHFFLPLSNGDHLCFSIQGEPNFAFNLIYDKYIQLNG